MSRSELPTKNCTSVRRRDTESQKVDRDQYQREQGEEDSQPVEGFHSRCATARLVDLTSVIWP